MAAWIAAAAWLIALSAGAARAQGKPLAVVAPVTSCESLAGLPLQQVAGAAITLKAASLDTPKGMFCHVTGTIAPAIGFEVDLPQTKWTQRFLQAGCGGLCGMINASIGNASSCQPALNGEFVVAATDLGHQGQAGGADEGAFAADAQKRIDFAYRANHVTALVAKALIRAYYGQPQRFAYFSGCSDGGREAMMEAERFPDDFDGISAGAPAMYFQVQNSLWHAWVAASGQRADGSPILGAAKLAVLHRAVLEHCDALDGNKDGLLSDPRACSVQAAWVQCAAGAADTGACLTAEEWGAAAKLYEGPTGPDGEHFLPGGMQPGSELQWGGGGAPGPPPPPPGASAVGAGTPPRGGGGMFIGMAPVVFLNPVPADVQATGYPFDHAQFDRAVVLHSLNDAVDTNLKPFAGHGGKLIMYHGWSDTSIAPMMSVAYFTTLQKQLGAASVDKFARLFMLPGMGHCGGGDGFAQFDTLSPLMAWVETGAAPTQLMTERTAARGRMANGPDGRGGRRQTAPYAPAPQPSEGSRPAYPFPAMAQYKGAGDPLAAASYHSVPSPTASTPVRPWVGSDLLAPAPEVQWTVHDGKVAPCVSGRNCDVVQGKD